MINQKDHDRTNPAEVTLATVIERFSNLDSISRVYVHKKILELLDEYEKDPDSFKKMNPPV